MPDFAQTAGGDLRGWLDGGVPYAAAPLEERRFVAPQPPATWLGLRDATTHGPIAPQAPSRLAAAMGGFTWPMDGEISTPAFDRSARPVLVWLPNYHRMTRSTRRFGAVCAVADDPAGLTGMAPA